MKVTTLHEPYASLVAWGHKTIETRDNPPPRGLIGKRIGIHAGKQVDKLAASSASWLGVEVQYGMVATARLAWAGQVMAESSDGWRVYVRKLATVPDRQGTRAVYFMLDVDEDNSAWGDFDEGRWLWALEDVRRIDPPVAVKGQQGWWDWDEERIDG